MLSSTSCDCPVVAPIQKAKSQAVALGQAEYDTGILILGLKRPGNIGRSFDDADCDWQPVPEITSGRFADLSRVTTSSTVCRSASVRSLCGCETRHSIRLAIENPARAMSSGLASIGYSVATSVNRSL